MEHEATGYAFEVVHQSGMMGDAGGECGDEEEQIDEFHFLLQCQVLEMQLEQLPLPHQHPARHLQG